jgi:hypothetical protein
MLINREKWLGLMRLSTQMKICRGSGVLVKIGNDWKIKHYVLSMTVPNENVRGGKD